MSQSADALVADARSVADRSLGNLVGANGWPLGILLRGVYLGVSGARRPAFSLLWPYGLPYGCLAHAVASLGGQDSYLVDSASSHMLVSKIKPCMSKYKQLYCETANGSLNQLSFI